jgi:membrane-associated protease RseP (regulator of RpoE activity)
MIAQSLLKTFAQELIMDANASRSAVPCLLRGLIVATTIAATLAADEPPNQQPDSQSGTAVVEASLQPSGGAAPADPDDVLLFTVRQSDSLIGVELAPASEVLRSHLGLADEKGLVVTSVADDSPAAGAGIEKNDVLVTVGSEEVGAPDALRTSLEASADKPIALGLIRAGKRTSVEVTPRTTASGVFRPHLVLAEPKYWLGIGLAAADDALRAQLALPPGEGLVVTSVDNDSPAAKAGVMVNDVLLKLDGKGLTTIEALSEQLQTIADKSVSLGLLRRGKPATLTVTPEKHADSWQVVNSVRDGVWRVTFLAPQQAEVAYVTHGLANFTDADVWAAGTTDVLSFDVRENQPDLVRQVGELEAQVKQLEASLAALRAAIEAPK